jgi:two-component system, NtrC family, response regulator AtoC
MKTTEPKSELQAATVLVVDDDEAVLTVVGALLEQQGLRTIRAKNGATALTLLARGGIDVVIADLRMPELDGMQLLDHIARRFPGTPVLMLTAYGTIPLAVDAMKRGAADFVLKPFNRDELLFVVGKALAQRSRNPRPSRPPSGELTGESPAMRCCRELITRSARGSATVLLRGETGTGKELAARQVHTASARVAGPFVRIHCAALPDSLLESELFGHEAGAFTGAVRRKPGRIELAQGGTLFLDEIGDVSLPMQVKLLHLLQDRQFSRLGGTESLVADVRFVAATHRDLEAMVGAGEFRADLFYRLNVVPIWLPPLRARTGDVPLLARGFLEELAAEAGCPELGFSDDALAMLAAHPWPGNVRQLRNFVERLVVLRESAELGAEDVTRELLRTPHDPSSDAADPHLLETSVRGAERQALDAALRAAGGNRTRAARILGISRRTLYKKLARLGA